MARTLLRKDTREWEKIKRRMVKAKTNVDAKVGFFPESRYGPDNDNLSVAQVAQWQEEGTRGGQKNGSGIPARPFMRTSIRGLRKDKDFSKAVIEGFVGLLDNRLTASAWAESLGLVAKRSMQDNIVKWATPPNSQRTIDLKGFNDPLVERGKMWESVDVKLGRKT